MEFAHKIFLGKLRGKVPEKRFEFDRCGLRRCSNNFSP